MWPNGQFTVISNDLKTFIVGELSSALGITTIEKNWLRWPTNGLIIFQSLYYSISKYTGAGTNWYQCIFALLIIKLVGLMGGLCDEKYICLRFSWIFVQKKHLKMQCYRFGWCGSNCFVVQLFYWMSNKKICCGSKCV